MKPLVTPAEMAAVDAAAPESEELLVDRAGRAVCRAAIKIMGGTYGRRVAVVAGPGNNGADGRVAAGHLRRRGVRCAVIDALAPSESPAQVDLVVDAAFGTGLKRPYEFPDIAPGVPVLAVDIPSGVDGLTGEIRGVPAAASWTVTFAALKPGLLIEPGRSLAGRVEVADIGLGVGPRHSHLVEASDVAAWIPPRSAVDHKWTTAVRVIAGSPGMTGAAHLSARGAQRAGAGYVQLGTPGLGDDPGGPIEAVGLGLPAASWAREAGLGLERFHALLVGPGLGSGQLRELVSLIESMADLPIPIVVDGDALALDLLEVLRDRSAPTVITPHDGEWRRLGGSDSPDRISAVREFASAYSLTVLRKGPSTVVADPDGEVWITANGGPELATAGTGDVLAGVTAALLARGLRAPHAAAAAAFVHADAARLAGPGLVAGDIPNHLRTAMSWQALRP